MENHELWDLWEVRESDSCGHSESGSNEEEENEDEDEGD
jgi:hypothetical protein